MTIRFVVPNADVGSGVKPPDGAKLFFKVTGTDDDLDTFTTETEAVANTNPVLADSNGVFPDIWLKTGGIYKVILKDKNNNQVGFGESDPVFSDATTSLFASIAAIQLVALTGLDVVETEAFLAGGIGTVAGPKGGATYFRDGTTGTASTLFTLSDGFFDANGDGFSLDISKGYFVSQFGAQYDDSTNDQPAMQNCMAACIAGGGGDYIFGQGTHLLTAVTGDDGVLEGLKLPHNGRGIDNTAIAINFIGHGDKTILKANTANMIVFRWSGENSSMSDVTIEGDLTSEGLALVAEDQGKDDYATIQGQSYNTFYNIKTIKCKIGVRLRVSQTSTSGCFFNRFYHLRCQFQQAASGTERGTGVKLDFVAGDKATPNRNQFIGGTLERLNTGFWIVQADTTYCNMSFEGIETGTTPHAVPTGIVVGALPASGKNVFHGCTMESITRNHDVSNVTTQFSFHNNGAPTSDLFPNGFPIDVWGGHSASDMPYSSPMITFNKGTGFGDLVTLQTNVGGVDTALMLLKGDPFRFQTSGAVATAEIDAIGFRHIKNLDAGRLDATTFTAGDTHSVTAFAAAGVDFARIQGRNASSADDDAVFNSQVGGVDKIKLTAEGSAKFAAGIVAGSFTTAEIEAVANQVNTSVNKEQFYTIGNSTTGRIIYASGALDASTWLFMDGTLAHTPV